jgi:hypothetical protein
MNNQDAAARPLQQMAEALLQRDDLQLRLVMQAWLRESPQFSLVPNPVANDSQVLTAAAALVELLALQAEQPPPPWTANVGGLPEPFFVMRRAERPGFTRDLCLNESPEPFKRRNIFAPPNFLHMV